MHSKDAKIVEKQLIPYGCATGIGSLPHLDPEAAVALVCK